MGDIANIPIDVLRRKIEESNKRSAIGRQKYVLWENDAIRSDYEFISCECNSDCWCYKYGCTGHYRIRNMGFDHFLDTFVNLWIPPKARENVRNAVLWNDPFKGRQRNAVPILRELMDNWKKTLKKVRGHRKCGLCDEGVPLNISVNNLYQAKMWSQLFYDSLVPFDTASRKRMVQAGYINPIQSYQRMNQELFKDLRQLAQDSNLNVAGLRGLDTPWIVDHNLVPVENGQPLSRVLDKMFYSP